MTIPYFYCMFQRETFFGVLKGLKKKEENPAKSIVFAAHVYLKK